MHPKQFKWLDSPELVRSPHSFSYHIWECVSSEIFLQVSFLDAQSSFSPPPHHAPALCVSRRDHNELRRLWEGGGPPLSLESPSTLPQLRSRPDPPAAPSHRPAAGWVPSGLSYFLEVMLCSPIASRFSSPLSFAMTVSSWW